MGKRRKQTIEEYIAIGKRIKRIRAVAMEDASDGQQWPSCKLLDKYLKMFGLGGDLGKLSLALEHQAFIDYPNEARVDWFSGEEKAKLTWADVWELPDDDPKRLAYDLQRSPSTWEGLSEEDLKMCSQVTAKVEKVGYRAHLEMAKELEALGERIGIVCQIAQAPIPEGDVTTLIIIRGRLRDGELKLY